MPPTFYYTTITDRLWTAAWRKNRHLNCVVNRHLRAQTFSLATIAADYNYKTDTTRQKYCLLYIQAHFHKDGLVEFNVCR